MADNSLRTPGSGEIVASDELTYSGDTAKIQLVRVVHVSGSEGSKTLTEMVSVDALRVRVHHDQLRIAVAPTMDTAAYATSDQFGPELTFANAARASGGTGRIVGVTVMDESDTSGPIDIWIFDSTTTPAGDNAVFSVADADLVKVVAVIQLMGSYDGGAGRISQAFNISVPYTCSGSANLYGVMMTRAAVDLVAADDITVVLYVDRD